MNVCVFGLWHLGSVTAAALAGAGHNVVGLDFNAETIETLANGVPPVFEPGLKDLTASGLAAGTLHFTTSPAIALANAEVLWVTFDTPVDDDDRADVSFVLKHVQSLFPHLRNDTLVVVSSQLPVGSVRTLENAYSSLGRSEHVSFVASPENLRLGKAIEVFSNPDRVVAGVRSEHDRARFAALMAPLTTSIAWMSVESAEMTKHALNAFLATSVAFANEIAVVCEAVGADARDVAGALKSDVRIGPRAYVGPGSAFAGGTLARDIAYLTTVEGIARELPVITSVKTSNDLHKSWARLRLHALLGNLANKRIGVWGLTYKPGTDTLRRSTSVELCRSMASEGAIVQAHDPSLTSLPDELARDIRLCKTAAEAARDVDALIVATEWPEYRDVPADAIVGSRRVIVIDASRFLESTLGDSAGIQYVTVGKGTAV